jgi:hypothetical protein
MAFVLVPSAPIKHPGTGETLEPTDIAHLTTEEGANAFMEAMKARQAATQQ